MEDWRRKLTARFWSLVEETEDGCWPWHGTIDENGYPRFGGRRAHRLIYAAFYGTIPRAATGGRQTPGGMDIDHLCHNRDPSCSGGVTCLHRSCVRPDHLEAVTHRENLSRGGSWKRNAAKTHCPLGHPYDEANTYTNPAGRRECRICKAEGRARSLERRSRGEPPLIATPPLPEHCRNGHRYTEANTRLDRGRRVCRACARDNLARYKERHGI